MAGALAGAALTILVVVVVALLVPIRLARATRRAFKDPEFTEFRGLLTLTAVTLAAGTIFYWRAEGLSLLDAFYLSSITLTTVGYGDLAPVTAAGKLFTVFYIFTGLGIVVGFVNAVARSALKERQHQLQQRHQPRRRRSGLPGDQPGMSHEEHSPEDPEDYSD